MKKKSYCLTIEVKSEAVQNGLGYMVAFCIPGHIASPEDLPEFISWREDVREAVLRAGDLCFHSDSYTKKLAIAELMHDLTEINNCYQIRIGFIDDVPAVQVHSTNLFDNIIEIEFSGTHGVYKVVEKNTAEAERSVTEHGKTGLTEAARKHFPFTKTPDAPQKKTPPPDHPRP